MSNYTPTINFTAKDALPTGNPSKVVSGVDFDLEFGNIQTSNNTKVDAAATGLSIASTTLDFDISALAQVTPAATDEFVIYDASGATHSSVLFSALEGALALANLIGYDANDNIDHTAVSVTAGAGLTGGGTIAATRDFAVGAGTGITVNADDVALDTGSALNADHSAISVTAGTGLTGGGTIAATRTINLDISGLTAMTVAPVGTDEFLYADGSTMKTMSYNQVALPSTNDSNARSFSDTDVGEIVYYTGTGGHTFTMVSGVGQDDCYLIVVNSGSGTLTLAGSGVTLNSANSLLDLPAGGIACLIRESSTVWFAGGALQ